MKLFVAVLATIGKLIPFPVIWKLWNALCHMDSRKERPLYFYTGYAPNWFYVEMKREWESFVSFFASFPSGSPSTMNRSTFRRLILSS